MEQDSAIEQQLHSGNPEVVDRLIEIHQHRLFRYLLALTGSRFLAEDLFQETWLRVLERGKQYRSQWKFEVWLFSIARNLAIDEVRRKKGVSLDEMMDSDEGTGFEPPAGDSSPFEELRAGEEVERIAHVLSKVSPVYREVLVLRFHEDLALDDIAVISKVPLSTVKSRLYRGLEALKKFFEDQKV